MKMTVKDIWHRGKFKAGIIAVVCALLLLAVCAGAVTVYADSAAGPAADTEVQSGEDAAGGVAGISVVYGILSVLALLLTLGCFRQVSTREISLRLLFLAVFVVNVGYFTLSISTSLEEALLANRLAYLGSVVLPLAMLVSIMNLCRIRCSKPFLTVLVIIGAAVFLLAASGGYCTLYYEDVSLVFVDGAAKLLKEYGPLHFLYMVYLLACFGMMIGVILFSAARKRITEHRHVLFLLIIVLMNIAVWFIEQLMDEDFEFLSVSYVATEMLMLLMYGILQTYHILNKTQAADFSQSAGVSAAAGDGQTESAPSGISGEDSGKDGPKSLEQTWPEIERLTLREQEVLKQMLAFKKQKEIAEALCVTEGTVKKHTTHIYEKLGVRDRNELYIRVSEKNRK